MHLSVSSYHYTKHLNEKELTEELLTCPFCNSSDRKLLFTLQQNPLVSLMYCKKCHAASATRMPTDAALQSYYAKYYESCSFLQSKQNVTFDKPDRMARHLTKIYWNLSGKSCTSILDYGGGDGSISYLTALKFVKDGVNQLSVDVVDYGTSTVTSEEKRVHVNKIGTLDCIKDKHYSYVIASAVIEHTARPKILLQDLLGRVEEGGLFYARTPWVVPYIKLLSCFRIQMNFTYPAHLHDLGRNFWESYFSLREGQEEFRLMISRPSIVATSMKKNFIRTAVACIMKQPWHLLGRYYPFVGGWEVFAVRRLRRYSAR